MLIRRKYVRQLSSYIGGLIPHTEIRLVVDMAQVAAGKRTRSGFDGLNDGDILLPPNIGRVSKFNAEGRFDTDRSKPKVPRFMGQREWTRQEWAGQGQTRTVTTTVDLYRDCFPRTFVPPPGVELTAVDHGGQRYIVSPIYRIGVTPDDELLHAINLMLEIFGELEIRHANLTAFLPPNTRRVNWTLLPPGNTAAGVSTHVASLVGRTPATMRQPVWQRLTFLASRNPPEVYLGQGGFHAYVAYVFHHTGMTILESVMPDNATYVFAGNWGTVSHLTKTQILAGGHHHARIIHDAQWQASLTPFV